VDTDNRVRGAAALDSYPLVGPLLTRRVNTQLIAENWDEIRAFRSSPWVVSDLLSVQHAVLP